MNKKLLRTMVILILSMYVVKFVSWNLNGSFFQVLLAILVATGCFMNVIDNFE